MRKPRENQNCPYCLSPIEEIEEFIRCPQCGVRHHSECWRANGKCSVYGCDGWALWNDQITEKLIPDTDENLEVSTADTEKPEQEEIVRCIKCGEVVGKGDLKCLKCTYTEDRHYFDNCSGPSIILLCGVISVIVFVAKALI